MKCKSGNICCEGCYRIGLKEGKKLVVEEIRDKVRDIVEDYYLEIYKQGFKDGKEEMIRKVIEFEDRS